MAASSDSPPRGGASRPEALPPPAEPDRINLEWTVRLRFGATAGQLATILAAQYGMGITLPLAPLLALIALSLGSNILCALRLRDPRPCPRGLLPALMALDVLVLTGLLSLSGGPFNPFSFLYLVHIALGAVVLPERWTWALMLLSVACSGVLFFHHIPLSLPSGAHGDHMRFHLRGMWLAFSIAAGFIVYFLLRVTRALGQREAELRTISQRAANRDRLAALATLAAGAAHELATPLGTIALVARELERHLLAGAGEPAALADARLIRGEVERCREVLIQLSADAGQSPGEALEPLRAVELLADVGGDPAAPGLEIQAEIAALTLNLPRRAMTRALRGLVKNARESGAQRVTLRAYAAEGALRIEVEDDGAGMTPQVRARAGEPFFTTKPPGGGMGLGLFLSRAVMTSLGGGLLLLAAPGGGTLARLHLPLAEETHGG